MLFSMHEIEHTREMFEEQNLDVRTITVGININDCADPDPQQATRKIYEKVCNIAGDLVSVVGQIDREYGIPIVNTRVAVSPISTVAASGKTDSYILYAQALDRAAQTIGIDYIGGFSALVHKDISTSDDLLIRAIPECLRTCKKVCSSLNLASSQAGINMDAVVRTAEAIQKTAKGGNMMLVPSLWYLQTYQKTIHLWRERSMEEERETQ